VDFEFATAQRIVFGRGKVRSLAALASSYGTKALLVVGGHTAGELLEGIEASVVAKGVACERLISTGEPETAAVDAGAARARDGRFELGIGIGGGSVIDLGKAVAGLATNGGPVRDYLEGVGTGKVIEKPPLPYIAVPTTAGTGSEVTKNAVISSRREGFKKSIRSHLLIPAVALVDPALTDSTPPAQTAASGLDALTQLVEPFVSTKAGPVTDALALEGMRRAASALPRVFRDGSDTEARDDMALASLLGGLCLANAGLGAVHGIAAALGALHGVPHGVACASVLAQVTSANVQALEARAPSSPALARYARVGETLTGRSFSNQVEARKAAVERLRELVADLGIPTLRAFGILESHLQRLVSESRGSSMKSNPVELTDSEISAVLQQAL